MYTTLHFSRTISFRSGHYSFRNKFSIKFNGLSVKMFPVFHIFIHEKKNFKPFIDGKRGQDEYE